jgi:toxin secretion/phage lysis holin
MIEKGVFLGILGVLVIPIEAVLGTKDTAITLLLIAMGLDILSGICKAIYTKQLSSKIGYKGFIRKIGIFIAIAVSHIIDQLIGNEAGTFRNLTIIFYITLEGLSIIENLAAMNILIPNFVKDKLKQINESTNSGDKSPLIAQSTKIAVDEPIEEEKIDGKDSEEPSKA